MTKRACSAWIVVMALGVLAAVRPALAQTNAPAHPGGGPPRPTGQAPIKAGEIPPELEGIGIADKAGAELPRDVRLTGSDGRPIVLGEWMDREKPLVIVLAYYKCPMLCSLVLNGATKVLKAIPESAGKDFRFLVVSFDPRDEVEVSREKRAAYAEAYGRAVGNSDYKFATGSETEVKRLADAIGFRYRWDEEQQQYAHAAGIFVVTPEGKLSQVLTGMEYDPDELSAALRAAEEGTWRSPLRSVLLYCFQLNPHTGKYVLAAGRAMQVGAAVTIVGIAYVLYRLLRAEKLKKTGVQDTLQTGKS